MSYTSIRADFWQMKKGWRLCGEVKTFLPPLPTDENGMDDTSTAWVSGDGSLGSKPAVAELQRLLENSEVTEFVH